jgi:DNA invertase Pin-like site-specific DNA recombinase
MSQVGYARVSSTGQSLAVQLDKLQHCNKVFSEKKSATSTNGRTALQECLNYLREGDQLVITRLDRLARSVMDLTHITQDLEQRKIDLVVIDQHIDTSTPTGRLMFNMLGAIAEFETALRKERQADGIAKALEKGVKFGAKAKLTEPQAR